MHFLRDSIPAVRRRVIEAIVADEGPLSVPRSNALLTELVMSGALALLAEELRRPIAVYVPQGSGFKAIVEYGAKYAKERPRVRILYNGQNHYDALLD